MSALVSSRTTTATTYRPSRDSPTSGSVASYSKRFMAAQTVSELANWDGRLDKQRQNSKWRRSSSTLARDPYHTPLEGQPLEISRPQGKFSDQRRAEQSVFRPSSERGSLANSSANARPPSRVDTTPTSSHDTHRFHQASIAHTASNPALQSSPLITSSISSHITPNSSVYAFHVHKPRPTSSRERKPTSTTETEVIDLTLEDTEDELCVSDMLVRDDTSLKDKHADPGPSHPLSSSGRSSPIAPEQSLFTPPPPSRRRTRVLIDFVAVPSFPKGLTRADYQPMVDHSVVLLPGHTTTNALGDATLAGPLAKKVASPRKRKGKERELDVSAPKKHERRSNGVDVIPGEFLDAICEHTMIPLHDDENYPPLTTLDLATNTRFQFAHAWRGHASKLREAEIEWMLKFRVLGKACIWARTVNTSSPRMPGTAGYVSCEQLRPWELVLPESSAHENSTKRVLDEQAHTTESLANLEVDATYLSLHHDHPSGTGSAIDLALSNPSLSQGLTIIDMEHDMHQYFHGFGDSPTKHVPTRQQVAPMHTFRPQLLQSAGHTQLNSLGLSFPSLELNPRLGDTGDHECFLEVPPSPRLVDMESSTIPAPISDLSFEPAYSPASTRNIFEASPADTWSFERGEGLMLDNDSPSTNYDTPTALSTIDPSLLGVEERQKASRAPKNTTPKRRSKLPEPVIYIRRPVDSSSLPLLSGKRPVRIKYRDSVDPQAPSNIEQSRNDTGDSSRAKRRSAPSRKLREYHPASESEYDYIPETSTSKTKLQTKRPSLRDKESVVERQGTAPSMSFCHQCRRTTERPKMYCSNMIQDRVCGKRFCNRCILYRYPDITFDEDSAGFLCPVCTNTCNCSHCSRNRGEEFISMRLGGLAASLFKTRVTLVKDVGKPPHCTRLPPNNIDARRSASAATTPTSGPGALPTQSSFWAHVYGIEGERVGSAFMTRGHLERIQTRGPSPPPPLLKRPKKAQQSRKRNKERESTRGPRVFIGQPLASWKIRAVRDLEPSADAETTRGEEKHTETGTGIATSTRRCRCYIGNAAPLRESYGRMPGTASPTPSPESRCSTPALDSDANFTPLSELDADYWPQPDVGECCSWAPPGSVVGGLSADAFDFLVPFASRAPGLGLPGAVGNTWQEVDGMQPGLGSGSRVEVNVDIGEERTSSSASTALSGEDVARAIDAAFAALGYN